MPDYRTMFDRKYIGAWDLDGKDVTVRIARVKAESLVNKSGSNKKPVIYFERSEKGFALNKTNAEIVAGMYGKNTDAWVGKQITLYPTQVNFGRSEVDAIRVRPAIPKGKQPQGIEGRAVDPEMRAKQDEAAAEAESESADEGP